MQEILAANVMDDKPALITPNPEVIQPKPEAASADNQEHVNDVYRLNQQAEEQIKKVEKGKKFTIELDPFELAQAMRAAEALGISVKEWLTSQITEKLTSNIGRAKIYGTSSSNVGKVTAPSSGVPWR